MDSFNSFSSFNSPSYNVNSWGSVTNNLGQSIGSVDRFGTFRDNLHPNYSCNVDMFGTLKSGLGSNLGTLNGYDSYQRNVRLRDSMDYLNKKDSDDSYLGKFKKSYEPEFKMPKYEPIIPFKLDPIIPYKEPKVHFNSPASLPLFPYTSNKKKSSFENDYGYKF